MQAPGGQPEEIARARGDARFALRPERKTPMPPLEGRDTQRATDLLDPCKPKANPELQHGPEARHPAQRDRESHAGCRVFCRIREASGLS